MSPAPLPPLAVSLGDPAGIGPEVVAKCWDHRSAFSLPAFLAVGDARSLSAVWDGPIVTIDDPGTFPVLKLPARGSFVANNFFAHLKRHDLGNNFAERAIPLP